VFQLFTALSETLNNQLKVVTAEKKEMVDEAERIITLIRQMEMSLDDSRSQRDYENNDLRVTFPVTQCLKVLKEKHKQISKLHRERFEQVKSKPSILDPVRRIFLHIMDATLTYL
jgi:protein regulator of cytokinesis 1